MRHRLKQIGDAIRTQRTRRKMSQRQLGELANLHTRSVSEIERGEVNMSVSSLLSLAEGLGVPAPALLQEAMDIASIEDITGAHDIVGVFYTAQWCGPCKAMKPTIRRLFDESGVELVEIDVEEHQELAQDQRITSLPTLDVYVSGELIDRASPPLPSKVRALVSRAKSETVSPLGG